MPAADLLALRLPHVLPVQPLLLTAGAEAEGHPAHHLLALHAALAVDGHQQRDVGQLKERHLEDEGLLVHGVRLSPPKGGLAAGHLLAR